METDSAASDAGLEAGDVVVEFDGEPITANDELTDAVTAHAPGDQVSLTVERRGRRRSFDVTLGPR